MEGMRGTRILATFACTGFAAMGCGRQPEQRSVDLTVPVTVQAVAEGRVEATVSATGTLRALRTAQLVTEVRGLFRLAKDDTGQSLRQGLRLVAGQTVVRLENEEFVVNARRESKQLANDLASRTLDEKQVLAKRGLVTQKEVDDARRGFEDARSSLQDAIIQIQKMSILGSWDLKLRS